MAELLVNTTTHQLQHQPYVAGFSTSGIPRFFAVWSDSSDATIKGRIFSPDGAPSDGELVINTSTPAGANTNRQLPIVSGTFSGPVVAWIEQAFNPPGPPPHVKAQRFNSEAQKLGPEIQVSTSDIDPEHRPAITSMIDGGFIVVWVDARPDQRIRAQRFNIDGTRSGPEFTVNITEGFHQNPIVTRLEGEDANGNQGNYVIAWRSDPSPPGGGALTFRIFNFDGTPVTGETRPNLSGFNGGKSMTLLDDGRFVIAHVRTLGTSDIGVTKSAVHANVFEPNGVSANIPIFATVGGQEINCLSPALAPLQESRFLLTWVQKRADTFDTTTSVRARVFSAQQGNSVGDEVQVNTTTAGDRFGAVVARAGGFGEPESAFITWSDSSKTPPDTSDFSVRARAGRIVGGLEVL
ncbi:hypothetical protein ACWDUM_11390 [Rhodococcus sp. NPDC003322]